MNIVDSSGWLEYADDGANAAVFEPPIIDVPHLLVPVVCLYEVFKRVLRDRGEEPALALAAQMRQGQLVELDGDLALDAARLRVELRLPFADSVILATARAHKATLWTQDADFDGIPGVRYIRKSKEATRVSGQP